MTIFTLRIKESLHDCNERQGICKAKLLEDFLNENGIDYNWEFDENTYNRGWRNFLIYSFDTTQDLYEIIKQQLLQ